MNTTTDPVCRSRSCWLIDRIPDPPDWLLCLAFNFAMALLFASILLSIFDALTTGFRLD